jgi:hypothetical protein
MTTQDAILHQMLEPLVEALTPESARALAEFQAKPAIQARVDQLATKCNEGELTEEERAEYENYVRIGNVLALIKAKARRVLAESSRG